MRYWRNSGGNFIFGKCFFFFFLILDVFIQGQTLYWPFFSGIVGLIDMKWKGSASVGYWVNYVILIIDFTHDHDFGFFKVRFQNCCISGIVGLIDAKQKGSESIGYWADYMTCPLTAPMTITLKFQNHSLISEMSGQLRLNERDVSHPFMTITLTFVWPE